MADAGNHGMPDSEQQRRNGEIDNNDAVVSSTSQGYFHGPQYSNNETIRRLTEEVRAIRVAQGVVMQELRDLRTQSQNYTLANAGLVAMNTNQQRIIQQMFVAHQPHLQEEVRQFHQAEVAAAANQNSPGGVVLFVEQQTMWEMFQSWNPVKQCICIVIIVGVTVIVGFVGWKFISFCWSNIVDFVEKNSQAILEKFSDVLQVVCNSPIFGPTREAIRRGNPLEIVACTQQLYSWQNLFPILALFLTYSTQNARPNNR